MRRSLLVVVLCTAVIGVMATQASAAGPGGWDHLGHGSTTSIASLDGAVYTMNTDKSGALLVGGAFSNAGGQADADYIANWNGSTWSAVGPGLNGAVNAIAYYNGQIFAGGQFTNAGGNPNADFLAIWDGTSWAPFCNGASVAFGGSVQALQIIGSTLYVGGSFGNGAGIPSADYLLACNLDTNTPSSTVDTDGDITGGVYALTADNSGNLYAAGQFINMDTIPSADHVARFDGAAWHAMGTGPSLGGGAVDDYVRSITSDGTNVYIGSDSVNIAGISQADHLARWNGSAWSAMGSNMSGTDGWFPASSFLYSMTTYGSLVFATGSFQNANGDPLADHIAYFDGSSWHHIGSDGAGNGPWIGNGLALAAFRQHLIAGGNFTSAGGDTMARSAASFPILQPDAGIGKKLGGHFLGNGIYSAAANGESKTISVARGHSGMLFASIQNDGLRADVFKIRATGHATGFKVRYFRGATNVTSRVRAGTFSTGSLAPGASLKLKIAVKLANKTAKAGSFLVKATSQPGAAPDAVKATVKAK